MPTHIALLRAVNLGAYNKVPMAELRRFFEALGFEGARTLLQSGNVVFEGGDLPTARLESDLEMAARERLGLDTDFYVRTAEEWADVVRANPFPKEAEEDPGHLLVTFLKRAPGAGAVDALQSAIKGREVVRAAGRQAYVVYPDGIGRSRLTAAVVEKHLGSSGTGRNWNTVRKLAALVGA